MNLNLSETPKTGFLALWPINSFTWARLWDLAPTMPKIFVNILLTSLFYVCDSRKFRQFYMEEQAQLNTHLSLSSDDNPWTYKNCSIFPFSDSYFEYDTKPNCTGTGDTPLPSSADSEHFQCYQRKGLHFLHLNGRSFYRKCQK